VPAEPRGDDGHQSRVTCIQEPVDLLASPSDADIQICLQGAVTLARVADMPPSGRVRPSRRCCARRQRASRRRSGASRGGSGARSESPSDGVHRGASRRACTAVTGPLPSVDDGTRSGQPRDGAASPIRRGLRAGRRRRRAANPARPARRRLRAVRRSAGVGSNRGRNEDDLDLPRARPAQPVRRMRSGASSASSPAIGS
jgi:hypothetical protein